MKFNLTKANQELLVKVIISIIIVGIVYIPTNNNFNAKINDLISDKINLFLVICLVGLVGYLDIRIGIMLVLLVLVLIVKNKNFEGFQNNNQENIQDRIAKIIDGVEKNKDNKQIVSGLHELSGILAQKSNNNKELNGEKEPIMPPMSQMPPKMPPMSEMPPTLTTQMPPMPPMPPTTTMPPTSTTQMPPMPPTTTTTSVDTSADTSTDTSADTSADTSVDTSADTSADTSVDTSADTSTDTSVDTSADTSEDTSADTTTTSNDSFQNTAEQEQEDRVVAYCRGFTQELCPPECSPLDCQPDPNEDDVIENFPRSSVPVNPKRKITEGFTSSCANVSGNLQTQTVFSDRVDLDIQGCRLDNRKSDLNHTNFGPPLASCESFNKETFDNVGTYFYPLN